MKILYICTGNACRSLLAEGFTKAFIKRNELDNIEVKSCGIYANQSYKIPDIVKQILLKEGIDVSNHISTPVSRKILEESDIIFVMEKTHLLYLKNNFPEIKNKARLLNKNDIPDPINKPEIEYIKTADKIKATIEKILPEILMGL